MAQITQATTKLLKLNKRIRAVCGGTSASKTYSIIMILIDYAQTNKNKRIDVISESYPHLEDGAIKDFMEIMQEQGYWEDKRWNSSKHFYNFGDGTVLKFKSVDKLGKAKGPRRDVLFLNEANHIAHNIYDQLEPRTKEIVWLDWNPSNEFWYYEHIKDKVDHDFITLTYQDCLEALDHRIIESIESRKANKSWWQVYGLGQLGEVEGKIYKGWKIIDEIPHEARLERYGMDMGFSCLSGETMIATDKGERRIDTIKKGDYVLTREGYKKVLWSGSRGYKEVYDIDFGLDRSIIITGDHRVYTKSEWKRVEDLSKKEVICELKQKHLKTGFTKDIQKENTQTTSTIKEGETVMSRYYTGRYTKNIMEKFLMDMLSTILILTPLIIIQIILLLLRPVNTVKSTITYLKYQKKECENCEKNTAIQKRIGRKGERNLWIKLENELKNALSAVKTLHRLTHTKSIADQYAVRKLIQETAKKNIYVRIVEKLLLHRHIIQETPALKNVHINSQLLKEKREVFDLTVEGKPEFFANGVLVHNCDPTAIIAIYYYNGGYILDEILCRRGMLNKDIADHLKNLKQALVVADSAEPKSIEEIRQYGINIVGARKQSESVGKFQNYNKWAIGVVQEQQISMTKQSINLIKAYRNYLWKTDKEGNILNEPDHYLSDCMDAVKYGMISLAPVINRQQMWEETTKRRLTRSDKKVNPAR